GTRRSLVQIAGPETERPMAIKLQCRCGWGASFEDNQKGMSLVCPECSREILVTTDVAEFRNRNVGDDDFAFATEDDDTTVPEAGSADTAPKHSSRRSGGPRRRGSKRNMDANPWDYDRRSRTRGRAVAAQKSWTSHPAVIGAILLAVVGVGYLVVNSMSRDQGYEKASLVAKQVAGVLKKQGFRAAREHFAERDVYDKLVEDFGDVAKDEMIFEAQRLKGEPAVDGTTYHAVYRFDYGDEAFRLSIHLGPSPQEWKVVKAGFRRLTAGERTKE
ncbi:MAG: hypothetical protein AAF581_05865, partial [Planctomycetota bacterium]